MRGYLGIMNDAKYFDFRTATLGPAIRVEWPTRLDISVIDQHIAGTLINHGYASLLTDDELKSYNDFVDGVNGAAAPDIVDDPQPIIATQEAVGGDDEGDEGNDSSDAEEPRRRPGRPRKNQDAPARDDDAE